MALLGFCAGHRMGVDVEFHQANIDVKDLASKFFSAREKKRILSLPVSQQTAAFYDCWTRKESFIKAVGHGLSFPLDQFSVAVLPDKSPQLIEVNQGSYKVADWAMNSYSVGKEYSASSIANLSDPEISTFSANKYLMKRL